MQSHPPRWNDLVLVCTNHRPEGASKPSCGGQGAAELQSWLKERLKAEGLWGKVRVLSTSCLDLCSRDGVTVVLDGGQQRQVLHPTDERQALLDQIRALAQVSADSEANSEV